MAFITILGKATAGLLSDPFQDIAGLLEIATEYREMLNGKAPADADDRLIGC